MAFAGETLDNGDGRTGAHGASAKVKPPISANPLFPWLVAVWFAALLGIGSLVMPTALFESAAMAIGLPAILPAAAPPLGFKAHAILALVAAIAGGSAGFILARKIAHRQNAPAPRTASTLDPHGRESRGPLDRPAKPISAQEELGSNAFDEPVHPGFGQVPGRRRALSVTDENARSDFLFEATLAGGEHLAQGAFDETLDQPRPLDLDDFELDDDDDSEDAMIPETSLENRLAQTRITAPQLQPEPQAEPQPEPQPAPAAFVTSESPEIMAAGGDSTEPAAEGEPEPASLSDGPGTTVFQGAAPAAPAETKATAPSPSLDDEPVDMPSIAARALRDLGTAELVERFALALQSHKDRVAEAAIAEAASAKENAAIAATPLTLPSFGETASDQEFVPPPPFNFGEPAPDEVSLPDGFGPSASADTATSTPAPQVPAFMRPVDVSEMQLDELDAGDHGDVPDLAMPRNTPIAPQDASHGAFQNTAETDEDEDEDGDGEGRTESDSFSSLLSMRNAYSSDEEFVRVDDEEPAEIEPAVVFPHQEAERESVADTKKPARKTTAFGAPQSSAEPGETEKALREALEKLQRMSGAA